MRESFKTLVEIALGTLIIFVAVMGTAFTISYSVSSYECSKYQEATSLETEMFGLECFVKPEGIKNFMPKEEYLKRVPQTNQININ